MIAHSAGKLIHFHELSESMSKTNPDTVLVIAQFLNASYQAFWLRLLCICLSISAMSGCAIQVHAKTYLSVGLQCIPQVSS